MTSSASVTVNPSELISICYEQSDCNEEGLTDFDDALRIYFERHQCLGVVVANYFACLAMYFREFHKIC